MRASQRQVAVAFVAVVAVVAVAFVAVDCSQCLSTSCFVVT